MPEHHEHHPVADVYADDASMNSSVEADRLFVFAIEADPEPDVLARTTNIFNLANVAPQNVHLERKSTGTIARSVAIALRSDILADLPQTRTADVHAVRGRHVQAGINEHSTSASLIPDARAHWKAPDATLDR